MKSIDLIILVSFVFSCVACDKKNADIEEKDSLSNTIWMAALTDDNPGTNPSGDFGMTGNNQYFPWLDCNLDDSFTFTAEQLIIDHNGTDCEEGTSSIFKAKSQAYSYDSDKKQLTIETEADQLVLQVYEVNQFRLKLGVRIPMGGNIVFLFKRK